MPWSDRSLGIVEGTLWVYLDSGDSESSPGPREAASAESVPPVSTLSPRAQERLVVWTDLVY